MFVAFIIALASNTRQPRYTIQDYHILGRELHLDVLRNQITRNLGILTKGLAAELDRGLKTWWGTDSQWKNIRAFDSCLKIVGAAANSVIFGPSLCRNHRFIYLLSVHAIILFIGGTLINVSPRLLKPIVGFPIKVASRYYYNQILKLCLPLVQDRLNKTVAWRDGLADEWSPPSDGLQWMIEEAFTKTDPTELDVKRLSERLIFLNDVSMHTSAFTLQSLLQRLAASDPRDEYIETLRNEARTVLSKFNGEWTREGVQNLVLLDSTIRESIRLSPFVIFGLPRTVVDPNGVLVKAHGSEYTLPFGGSIALPIEDTHYDEQVYPNAKTFQPFRFVHLDDGVTPLKSMGTLRLTKTAVTLDEHFYGFGYGKHGCPGRFFVVHEIKLIMANILLNYDIKHIQSPTEPFNIMWLKLPINDPILQIRRRVSGIESREGI
ncbi:unnamed protein product [Clonostachys chloroleuca]|uniref:Cytochrome P450 n=1 Tax=Clonostachys chloroleuca TaxID=1926264 RepID=A0AA35QBN9_9HYPO|nr:unnamed protein product [Clonostachys chloroleuca]